MYSYHIFNMTRQPTSIIPDGVRSAVYSFKLLYVLSTPWCRKKEIQSLGDSSKIWLNELFALLDLVMDTIISNANNSSLQPVQDIEKVFCKSVLKMRTVFHKRSNVRFIKQTSSVCNVFSLHEIYGTSTKLLVEGK